MFSEMHLKCYHKHIYVHRKQRTSIMRFNLVTTRLKCVFYPVYFAITFLLLTGSFMVVGQNTITIFHQFLNSAHCALYEIFVAHVLTWTIFISILHSIFILQYLHRILRRGEWGFYHLTENFIIYIFTINLAFIS